MRDGGSEEGEKGVGGRGQECSGTTIVVRRITTSSVKATIHQPLMGLEPGRYRPSGRYHQLWMRLFNCGDAMYRIVVFLTLSVNVASGASDSSKMDKATKDFLFVAVEAIVGTGAIYAVFRFIVHRLTSHIDARREEDLENADIEASGSGEGGDTRDELADDISGDSKQGDEAETRSASVTELPRMQSLRLEVLYYPL